MKPVRIAVVGVGSLGQHHARKLAESPGVVLAGVADPNGGWRCKCLSARGVASAQAPGVADGLASAQADASAHFLI